VTTFHITLLCLICLGRWQTFPRRTEILLLVCNIVEFDSWYEESFLGGVTTAEAAQAGSASNVQPTKPESLTKTDTCVRHYKLYRLNFIV